MKTKLINGNSNNLIIFLTGWGSDDKQFKDIKCNDNLLICWDYSDVSFDFDFSKYNNIYLIAYSAGVYVAGLIKNKLPKIKYSFAINGNPKIFDDYYGIDKKVIKEMYSLNLKNYIKFRREYLVFDEKELDDFNKYPSYRTFESCFEELNKLEEYYTNNKSEFDFDLALISDNDKIFNPNHQKEYFKKHIILQNMAHNIFCKYTNLSKIIELEQHL